MLLVDNGINSNGSFSSLSITNNQFSLSSSDWYQGVDGLESGLHGLVHRLSWDNTWSFELNSLSLVGLDWTGTVNWITKGVDDSTEKAFTDWDIDNGTSSLDNISFLNLSIVTQDDDTNVVSLKIEGHTLDS